MRFFARVEYIFLVGENTQQGRCCFTRVDRMLLVDEIDRGGRFGTAYSGACYRQISDFSCIGLAGLQQKGFY